MRNDSKNEHSTFFLGIHESNINKQGKSEILANDAPHNDTIKTVLQAISKIQNSISKLERKANDESQHFPYKERGSTQTSPRFYKRSEFKQQKCFFKQGRIQDFHNKQQKNSNSNNINSKTQQNSADQSQAESERYCSFHRTTTNRSVTLEL